MPDPKLPHPDPSFPSVDPFSLAETRSGNNSTKDPDSESDQPTTTKLPCAPPGYEILEEIGRGGMGVVYRGRDLSLSRDVALKLLRDKYTLISLAARRFVDEAKITAQLQHPGIPAVHEVGELPDGRPFLVMKLIKGRTLTELIGDGAENRGSLIAVFERVCQAVAYAHNHGVVHRDLKPANVMVGAFGEVQVMDWGLAKFRVETRADSVEASIASTFHDPRTEGEGEEDQHTRAGSFLGTPAYMSPEQAIGAVDQIDERSDVFGLGAVLCVILTREAPFVATTTESMRQLAAQKRVEAAYARLDSCGAEPGLVALCKRCLEGEREARFRNAGEVASAVHAIRMDVEERARQAELDRVRLEGERVTAEARSAERRKRRRLAIGAAAVLALALVGGLSAVLLVQRQANTKLAAKNGELEEERERVQERFDLARKAIATFHTGVSEEMLLQNGQFQGLQTKLLREAAVFYQDLEKLVRGQNDARSRKLLAASYEQLGNLTAKIGSKPEGLAVHQQALAIRRELASMADADVETRLDVARSLLSVGHLLNQTGDITGAMAAYEEARRLAERLEAEMPTPAVQSVFARSYYNIGLLLSETGKREDALAFYQKSLDIRQKLADANPAVTDFQRDLAWSHYSIGWQHAQTGRPGMALEAYRQSLDIRLKLADANPASPELNSELAWIHHNIGYLLMRTGEPEEALVAYQKALDIRQKLASANPAVTEFQRGLAWSYYNIGALMNEMGKHQDMLEVYQKSLDIRQKLIDANPSIAPFQREFADSLLDIGWQFAQSGKNLEAIGYYTREEAVRRRLASVASASPGDLDSLANCQTNSADLLRKAGKRPEALAACKRALAIRDPLVKDHPLDTNYRGGLAETCFRMGQVLQDAEDLAAAAASWRRAIGLYEELKILNGEQMYFRACCHAELSGLSGRPGSGVPKEEVQAEFDRAMYWLRKAVGLGYRNTNAYRTESGLDALRGREEFQKLVLELEAKKPKVLEVAPLPRSN